MDTSETNSQDKSLLSQSWREASSLARLAAASLTALLIGTSSATPAAPICVGTLTLEWPGGFTNQRFADALLLDGPNHERVLISYLRGGNGFPDKDRARFDRMHCAFAVRSLPQAAAGATRRLR
jgi:hypothetical protein